MNTQLITINQKSVTKLANSKLLLKRSELAAIVKEAEAILSSVNDELLNRVTEQGTDGRLAVDDQIVTLVRRPVLKDVTLETAAKYGALKTVIDSSKILPLWKAGKKIKGLTVSEYITVK